LLHAHQPLLLSELLTGLLAQHADRGEGKVDLVGDAGGHQAAVQVVLQPPALLFLTAPLAQTGLPQRLIPLRTN
jgi:hypothetical protein